MGTSFASRPFPMKRLLRVSGLSAVWAVCALGSLAAQTPPASPSAAATGSPVALDAWLVSPTLWQTAPGQIPAVRAMGLHWVSDAHDAARTAKASLRLRDLPVAEMIVRFSPAAAGAPAASPGSAPAPSVAVAANGKTVVSGIQISIYNRGDAGDLDQRKFDALVEQTRVSLDTLTGVKSADRGVDNTSAVPSKGLVWVTPASRFLLEWSATPENKVQGITYRAEFVRLKVTPALDQPRTVLEQMRAASSPPAAASKAVTVHAADLPARVVKDPDGGEWLPKIPMVDQGQKGYCVTAATERVLRYYGVDVDQNELAQIANTSTTGGTSTSEMVTALRKLAGRFRVNVITEDEMTYPLFLQEINDYNRVARKAPKSANAPLIDVRGNTLSYETIINQMNGEVLREARTKLNPAYVTKFEHDIQSHIERGIPLLWSVSLGLLPETKLPPQVRGGHMRLIIGYNAKTKEVYYSDTWGLGHELKKMPLPDAWTMTDGLFTLEPI